MEEEPALMQHGQLIRTPHLSHYLFVGSTRRGANPSESFSFCLHGVHLHWTVLLVCHAPSNSKSIGSCVEQSEVGGWKGGVGGIFLLRSWSLIRASLQALNSTRPHGELRRGPKP